MRSLSSIGSMRLVAACCALSVVASAPQRVSAEAAEPAETAGSGEESEDSEAAEPVNPRAQRPPKYLRAAVWEVGILGVGAAWYYLVDQPGVERIRPPWRDRFTRDVVRLDNNTFEINFIGHPLTGAYCYALPRANGMSLAASAAYGFAASFLWEYVIELQEKISLNDLITTPVSGIAIGEFISRLSVYLNSAPGGGRPIHRAFGWTLGLTQALHDAWDDLPPTPASVERDALGYDAAIAHRFTWRLGAALAHAEDANGRDANLPLAEALLEGRLVALPGYLRRGTRHGYFGDANVTRMRMRVGAGPSGHGFELDADTILLGLHAQRMRQGRRGPRGASVIFGASLGYHYHRAAFEEFRDRVGSTRLPGPALDIEARGPRFAFFMSARLHPDFAGIYAATFPEWQAVHPGMRTKTILEREGYYYGWGVSESLRLRLELPLFAIETTLAHGRYASHDGLDRDQEALTFDVEAHDRLFDAEVLARVGLGRRLGFFLELGVSRRTRDSKVGGASLRRRFDQGFARLGQVF